MSLKYNHKPYGVIHLPRLNGEYMNVAKIQWARVENEGLQNLKQYWSKYISNMWSQKKLHILKTHHETTTTHHV